MSETEKKVTETVTNKNTVKISLDEYNRLMREAARPVVQNVTKVLKTNAQHAADNRVYGIILCGLGSVSAISGLFLYLQSKKFVD